MSAAVDLGGERRLHPDAVRVDDDGRPWLKGVGCACGHVGFPFQTFGCERCGRTDLQPLDLAARGVIAAAAVIPMVLSAGPPPPFAVASIRLDEGPMVRALLADLDGAPGEAVEGVMVKAPKPDETGAALDLRFRRLAAGGTLS